MLVKEVDGAFLPWFGTNELPATLEFTATDEELAAHGLFRPLPEDTMKPTHYHLPSGVTFARVEGQVKALATFVVTSDVDDAKAIALALLAQQKVAHEGAAISGWPYPGPDEHIVALFDARLLEHTDTITAATTVQELIDLDLENAAAWPTVDMLPS